VNVTGYVLDDLGSNSDMAEFSLHCRCAQTGCKAARGVKLATNLHVVPRLKMSGAKPALRNTSARRGA
jgi:hypothetical protein